MGPFRLTISLATAVALTLVIALGALVPSTSAQESQRWTSMAVSIWPEYDQPSIFVNYEGELAPSVTLPATVRLALPSGYQVSSACEIDAQGQHTVVTHTALPGDTPGVSWPTGKKDTHIEFYFNPIEGMGKRDLTYKFVSPGNVDSLVVELQQPLRTSGFTTTPASKQVVSDKQGFKYHRFEYANVTAGQTITFTMSYEKSDAKPSVEPQKAPTTAAAATGGAGSEYALPLVVIGLGFVGLAGFFFTRQRPRPARRVAYAASGGANARRKGSGGAASSRATTVPQAGAASAGFCTSCGTRLRPGAAFCASCGQAVKRRS